MRQNKRLTIKKNPHKINDEIFGKEVRLVGDDIDEGVYDMDKAKSIAQERGMDLVLMSPSAKPVVCKIMDYNKFLYKQNKKKPKNKAPQLKEVRFSPNIGKGDLEFKTNNVKKFIEKGHKVKVFVFFKGREMAFQDKGKELLLNIAVELEEVATPENMPKMESRNKMAMFLKPKK